MTDADFKKAKRYLSKRKNNPCIVLNNCIEIMGQDIKGELLKQLEKWGVQNHEPEYWLAILAEETGEYAEAILNHRHPGGMHPDKDMEDELIDVAASAIAALECIRAKRLRKEKRKGK